MVHISPHSFSRVHDKRGAILHTTIPYGVQRGTALQRLEYRAELKRLQLPVKHKKYFFEKMYATRIHFFKQKKKLLHFLSNWFRLKMHILTLSSFFFFFGWKTNSAHLVDLLGPEVFGICNFFLRGSNFLLFVCSFFLSFFIFGEIPPNSSCSIHNQVLFRMGGGNLLQGGTHCEKKSSYHRFYCSLSLVNALLHT